MKNTRGVSISTSFNENIPLLDQLPLIAHAGFTHISVGSCHLKYGDSDEAERGILNSESRKAFQSALEVLGLEVDTLHGGSFDEQNALNQITALVEAAVDLNVDTIVLHPYRGFETFAVKVEEKIERLLEVCHQVEPLLQTHHIRLAIENLHPQFMDLILERAFNELNPEWFGFCYDSSHDQLDGPKPFDLLSKFANRLFAVHLSDRSQLYVDHQLPGEGYLFFADICRLLRQYGYDRPVQMEVLMENSMYKDPETFLYKAFQSGRMILNQISPIKR